MPSLRTVRVGSLPDKAGFTYRGRPFIVSRNLGVAGVSVQPIVSRVVRIGEREFVAHTTRTEVWTASAPVQVEG